MVHDGHTASWCLEISEHLLMPKLKKLNQETRPVAVIETQCFSGMPLSLPLGAVMLSQSQKGCRKSGSRASPADNSKEPGQKLP